jgi:hypothetical protein
LERFLPITKIFGVWSLLIVAIILAFNWWGVIDLSKLPFHTVDILYGYLILNTFGIVGIIKIKRPKTEKFCPICDSALQSKPHYSCPKCGDISFTAKETTPTNNLK